MFTGLNERGKVGHSFETRKNSKILLNFSFIIDSSVNLFDGENSFIRTNFSSFIFSLNFTKNA